MANERRKQEMQYLWTSPTGKRFIPVTGLKIGQLGVCCTPVGGEVIHIASGRNVANCSNVLTAARLARELEKRGFDFDTYYKARNVPVGKRTSEDSVTLSSGSVEMKFIRDWLEDNDIEDLLY